MQNRCCAIGCFLNNSSNAHAHWLETLMVLRNFITMWAFTVYIKNSLWFEISLWSIWPTEICTKVSLTPPEVMWTLIMKLPHTEVKFYPELKSQTGLSSLQVSCKRALRNFYVTTRVWFLYEAQFRIRAIRSRAHQLFEHSRYTEHASE